VVAVGFTFYCLIDLARAKEVRSLSQGVWMLICLVSMPWGGIVYMMVGKVWKDRDLPGYDSRRWPMWRAHNDPGVPE
jgi:hypothetical protein